MELETVRMILPKDTNIVIGQTHFIKTAEDLYEAIVNAVPGAQFAIAFNEASGPCLVRAEATDEELRRVAIQNAQAIGAGHIFVVLLRNLYPINVLRPIKDCVEVCCVYCASANPVEVIVAKSNQGRGVLGVIDGLPPKGVESDADVAKRKEFLRAIGYKR
jgi:adenosine/AMP kinase